MKVDSPLSHIAASPSLFILWFFANLLVDYVSLSETRGVISMIGSVPQRGIAGLLVGDFMLTVLIFVLGGVLALSVTQSTVGTTEVDTLLSALNPEMTKLGESEFPISILYKEGELEYSRYISIRRVWSSIYLATAMVQVLELSLEAALFWQEGNATPIIGIFLYSTFLTSVWVWLYFLGGIVIKIVEYIGLGTAKLRRWLDVENQPMRAIGYMCIIIVTIGFLVFPIIC